MSEKQLTTPGEILDENIELSLDELAQRCAVHTELVLEMVEEGVLEPRGEAPGQWYFSGHDLVRLRKAVRLQRDLKVNLPGVALALELLEELDALHARLRQLDR